VQNEAYAEDLLQEVFLRLWRRAYQWKGIGKVKNWLARMATNLALNYLRSIKRRESQLRKLELEKDCEIERVLEHEEMYEKMKTLISSLPNHHRKVIEMVYQMEMDIEEVANELNISRGTVKSRLHYARKTLTERWRNIKKLYK
jgi:RNA polymerase sigma-70 factor (ECF subfamily)